MFKRISRFLLLSCALLLYISCTHNPGPQAKVDPDRSPLAMENQIHYVEVGQGPPLILIPGLFGIHSGFNRVIPLLKGHNRLIAIDNFGTGQSERPEKDFDYTVAEQAKMVSFADRVHDLELQKPREVAALILDFIGPHASGPLVVAADLEPQL